MSIDLSTFLACPRCDKMPLDESDGRFRCKACKIDFPSIEGMPWMFAEPEASLGEWRNRLHMALKKISHDIAGLEQELGQDELRPLTKRRIERYKKALETHKRALQKLLRPVDLQSMTGNYESYLALRTRLPTTQGLNTYYSNVHRDWAWGDAENEASLNQIRAVVQDNAELGHTLVLGAGSARLAYDIHMHMNCASTIAFDFNPMLLLIAQRVTRGEPLKLHEFPVAPKSLEDDAILRTLNAPEPVRDGFAFVLGDALRPPFAAQHFDTVVTPWLIDIISEDLTVFATRVNTLLKPDGRWLNCFRRKQAPPSPTQYVKVLAWLSPEQLATLTREWLP